MFSCLERKHRSRSKAFAIHHESKKLHFRSNMFGLQPVQRLVQGTITTVQCLFCVHIGREKQNGAGVKRQRTKIMQLFQFPFRLEAYKNHLKSQHPEYWTSYQLLSYQEKISLFKTRDISGIHRYLDTDKDTLQFVISQSSIFDVVVRDLFFHPEEDNAFQPIIKANAMKLFKLQPDRSYLVTIKNSLRFNLAMEHVSVGLSFRQTAKVIEQHPTATKNPKLNGINDHMVSQFVRVLLAIALPIISDILMDPNI